MHFRNTRELPGRAGITICCQGRDFRFASRQVRGALGPATDRTLEAVCSLAGIHDSGAREAPGQRRKLGGHDHLSAGVPHELGQVLLAGAKAIYLQAGVTVSLSLCMMSTGSWEGSTGTTAMHLHNQPLSCTPNHGVDKPSLDGCSPQLRTASQPCMHCWRGHGKGSLIRQKLMQLCPA